MESASVSLDEASYLSFPDGGYFTRELCLRILITVAIFFVIQYCIPEVSQYFVRGFAIFNRSLLD